MLQKAKQNLAFKKNADLFPAFFWSFGNAREWENARQDGGRGTCGRGLENLPQF